MAALGILPVAVTSHVMDMWGAIVMHRLMEGHVLVTTRVILRAPVLVMGNVMGTFVAVIPLVIPSLVIVTLRAISIILPVLVT